MQSLGVRLRLERQRQKIGIEKIAEATCISQRYLEAIEADDQSSALRPNSAETTWPKAPTALPMATQNVTPRPPNGAQRN